MFAIARLFVLAYVLQFQIALFGLRVRVRETAYHLLTRYSFRTGLLAHAFDPDDEETKAAIDAAVEKATSGLVAKNREIIAKLRKAEKGVDIDPAEVERLEGEIDALKGQLSEAQKAAKLATTSAEKATKDLAAEQSFTQRLLIENGLTAELTAAGVTSPHLLKAAAALIRDELKPAVVLDGDNRVAKVGDKLLADAVKEWAGSDAGKTFVSAPGHSGGGAQGGAGKGGAKAWKDMSLTEQSQLYQSNPAQAKALAGDGGVTLQ